jgi:hypothetical protein
MKAISRDAIRQNPDLKNRNKAIDSFKMVPSTRQEPAPRGLPSSCGTDSIARFLGSLQPLKVVSFQIAGHLGFQEYGRSEIRVLRSWVRVFKF